ncbi:MAG: DUF502 domain-containing protein [Bacteroidetes bacterium]|nr:DUF502 domain-containing protein [Bacteroidota bacterium]
MNEAKNDSDGSVTWKKIFYYFLQGLIIIAPVGITLYIVLWLFNTVDNILPNIIHTFFPRVIGVDADGNLKKIPGLGFIVVLLLVLIIGRISSSFLVSRMVDVLDTLLERTPGIKFIYTSIKDFLEAFTGNKKKFDKPVLVSVDAPGIWRIGFITQEDAAVFELVDYTVVYIPLSYALTGITYIIPRDKIKPLSNISSANAMKFAVSGGVADISEHLPESNESS